MPKKFDREATKQKIDQFINEKLEFGSSYVMTIYGMNKEMRAWWEENCPGEELPYNARDIMNELMEVKYSCRFNRAGFGGQNSSRVFGARIKGTNNIVGGVKARDTRDVYKVRVCIYCQRSDVKLTGAVFEDGLECADLEECVSFMQGGMKDGSIDMEPQVTVFSTQQFRNVANDVELEARQKQDGEYTALIDWLKVNKPDEKKRIHYTQIKRTRNRGVIRRLRNAILSREKQHA